MLSILFSGFSFYFPLFFVRWFAQSFPFTYITGPKWLHIQTFSLGGAFIKLQSFSFCLGLFWVESWLFQIFETTSF